MNKFKTYLKNTAIIIVVGAIILSLAYISYRCAVSRSIENYPYEVIRSENMLKYSEIESKLIDDVNSYIDSVAPSSNLNGYTLVRLSLKYNLDICFVLAQGHIESHFGTFGMASKTNSVFNVGAYDGVLCEKINGVFKYKHPDFSVEPYMKLLYKDYITDNKTELNLLNKFVNKHGKRYASDKNYEEKLLSLYKRIKDDTDIYNLQKQLHKYGITLGIN